MELKNLLELLEGLTEGVREAVEARPIVEESRRTAGKLAGLNKDIEQKTEMLKGLDAKLKERRAAVEKYEAVHGKIERLSSLDEQIKVRTVELQQANRAYTEFVSQFPQAGQLTKGESHGGVH